jgi:hypothetical protein
LFFDAVFGFLPPLFILTILCVFHRFFINTHTYLNVIRSVLAQTQPSSLKIFNQIKPCVMKIIYKLSILNVFLVVVLALTSSTSYAQPQWSNTTTSNGDATSVVINKPASLVQDDLLIFALYLEKGNQVTVTPPTGFTLIRQDNDDSNFGMRTYSKVATASEPNTYTFSLNTSGKWAASMSRITGADTSAPIMASSGNVGSSGNAVAPSLTSSQATLVLSFHGRKNGTNLTVTAPWEKRSQVNFGSDVSNMLSTLVQSSAGATGNNSVSTTTSGNWAAQQIAIAAPCISASVASSSPVLCINNPLPSITHTTIGATGIGTPMGLPTGVTATWTSNTITVSGTPTVTGVFNYTIPLTGGCQAANATGTITVNQSPITTTGIEICAGGQGELTASSSCSSLTGQSSGPRDAGTGANRIGVGTVEWGNPQNIALSGQNAGMNLSSRINSSTPRITNYLQGTGYGFDIPLDATINGLTVTINRQAGGSGIRDNEVSLVVENAIQTTNKADTNTNWPTSLSDVNYGGTNDLWGTSISAAQINSANFGVVLSARNTSNSNRSIAVRFIKITVTYTVPGSLNWYTVSSGGTVIGTGSSFNPVGVANSGLVDTNTPGTTSYWVECSTAPENCRVKADFKINPAPSAGTLSGTQEICVSGTTTFGSSVSGGSWSSSNAAVATINSSTGEITGMAPGEAIMTYTVTGTGVCANAVASRTRTVTVSSCVDTWTGALSSDWSTAGNWSNNAVPNNQTNVIIPALANQPVVSGSTVRVAGSIIVENGGVLTIASDSGLEVTNNITVAEGGEFIVSDKANLGQVNPNAVNTGIVKVRRNTMELRRLDYVLWSSPTQGTQTLKQFSPQTVDNRFYTYNSATNQYNVVTNNHTPFESGKGYLIRTPNNHSEAPAVWSTEFQGMPNNGTIVQQMPAPRSGNQNRFFLVGNPYASAINIQAFLDVNDDNITGITYIWRKTNGTNISAYGVLNRNSNGTLNFTSNGKAQDPGNCIASGQGFIVEMKEGASEVVFTNVMRVCNGFGVLNRMIQETNSAMESDAMQLKLTQENGQFTFASLGYYANASNDFEESYDAQAMGDGTLSLATALEDKRLVSQSRAAFTTSDIVPLSIITPAAGTYEIAIDQMSGIFQNQVVYLEDTVTQIKHNLSQSPYLATLTAGTHNDRYRLTYQNELLSVETPAMNNDDFQIAVQQQTVAVRTSANIGITAVTVMDIQGKMIAQTRAAGATETSVYIPQIKNQAALVKIEAENGTVTYRKIML